MENSIWNQMHGATTHFPIALTVASFALDTLSCVLTAENRRRDLRTAAYYCLLLGALGSLGAVLSGLLLSNGTVLGEGLMAKHHLFLWPAFALLIGLAVWRFAMHNQMTSRTYKIYLGFALAMTLLMGGAGYWGGEMIMGN